jgi:uncharacterized membrane protein
VIAVRRRQKGDFLGWFAVLGGVVIILALILPTGFWWFALAVALIAVGIWLIRRC